MAEKTSTGKNNEKPKAAGDATQELTAQAAARAITAVALEAGDLLAWRDYGTHVVVVTKAGRKYSSLQQG